MVIGYWENPTKNMAVSTSSSLILVHKKFTILKKYKRKKVESVECQPKSDKAASA